MPSTIINEPTSSRSGRSCIYTILLAAMIGSTGCSKLGSILRDELALESEILDRIASVVDEADAIAYNKAFHKLAADKADAIGKKKIDVIENELNKIPRTIWKAYEQMVADELKKPVDDNMLKLVQDLGRSGAVEKCMQELKDELKRLDKLPDKAGAWEKALADLPPPKMFHYYKREKLALRIVKHRETTRLKTLLTQKKISF